jgi:iron complex transport system substrate-binding protein
MRIVSLLPSATEIVYALGLEDHLVGVTDECDWPPQARTVRVVSRSALPPVAEPAEIDRLVSASIGGCQPIYRLDIDAIGDLRPDLVLAQDLCAVCAVPSGQVNQALDVLGCQAEVISLDPSSLDEVLEGVLQVGKAAGVQQRAQEVVAGLRERLASIQAAVAGLERPRVFALEWGDPPFNGGHWVPEMLQVAGAEAVLACPGGPSVRVTWEQIEAAAPQVVVFMPCGYGLQAAVEEASRTLLGRPELAGVEAIVAVDASAYCSRPGPRLVDGVEILAAALHPERLPPPPAGTAVRLSDESHGGPLARSCAEQRPRSSAHGRAAQPSSTLPAAASVPTVFPTAGPLTSTDKPTVMDARRVQQGPQKRPRRAASRSRSSSPTRPPPGGAAG